MFMNGARDKKCMDDLTFHREKKMIKLPFNHNLRSLVANKYYLTCIYNKLLIPYMSIEEKSVL